MKPRFRHLAFISLALPMLVWVLASCNEPKDPSEYKNGPRMAKVSLEIKQPTEPKPWNSYAFRPKISTLPQDTKTILIVAVPAGTDFKNNYNRVSNDFDRGLLDLSTSTVELSLPMDTKMTLFEYSFNQSFTLNQLNKADRTVITSSTFKNFTITDTTKRIDLAATPVLKTQPDSIEITANKTGILVGDEIQLKASGVYANGSRQDLTNLVEWEVTQSTLASITNSQDSKGMLTGLQWGEVTVTAKTDKVSANSTLKIDPKPASLAEDFKEFFENGSSRVKSYRDNGTIYFSYSYSTYDPITETIFGFDPKTGTWSEDTSGDGGQRLTLKNGQWVEGGTQPAFESLDKDTLTMVLIDPAGTLVLKNVIDLTDSTYDVITDGEESVVVDFTTAGAKLYEIEYNLDYSEGYYSLDAAEGSWDENPVSYKTLGAFIKASVEVPFHCIEGTTQCLLFDGFTSGKTSGTIYEIDYNKDPANPTATDGGTWSIAQVQGVNILSYEPTNSAFLEGEWKTFWAVYESQVWRGHYMVGEITGGSTEFNPEAMEDIKAHFTSLPETSFSYNDNPQYLIDAFDDILTNGTYDFDIRSNNGMLEIYSRQEFWYPYSLSSYLLDPDTRTWSLGSDRTLYHLEDGKWVEGDNSLNVTEANSNSLNFLFENPTGYIKLIDVQDLQDSTHDFDHNGMFPVTYKDPLSKLFYFEIFVDYSEGYYTLSEVEGSWENPPLTFATLGEFLQAKTQDCLTWANDLPRCVYVERYTDGQLSGNLIELDFEYSDTDPTASEGGSWKIETVQGQEILSLDITAEGYKDSSWKTFWAAYNGEVWRGGSSYEASTFYGEYLNKAAFEETKTYLQEASSDIFYYTGGTNTGGSSTGGDSSGDGGGSTQPVLVWTEPTDGSTDVDPYVFVAVVFDRIMNTTTVTVNTVDDSCSGTFQVSMDDFQTCVQMSGDPQVLEEGAAFVAYPLYPLEYDTTYVIRIIDGIFDTNGEGVYLDYYNYTSFTTSAYY